MYVDICIWIKDANAELARGHCLRPCTQRVLPPSPELGPCCYCAFVAARPPTINQSPVASLQRQTKPSMGRAEAQRRQRSNQNCITKTNVFIKIRFSFFPTYNNGPCAGQADAEPRC